MASLEKYKQALKDQKKTQIIKTAISHENRLKFHTEAYLSINDISTPVSNFLDWVRTLLPKDKYFIFTSLFRFPTPVVELNKKIYNELERVFDGRNPVKDYRFKDSDLREDWTNYQKERLDEPDIWRNEGWDRVKTAINSIIVVDLPEEQTTELPEPYFYFLDIDKVIDYDLKGSKLDYLIFKQEGENVAIFDDEFFRVVQVNDKNEIVAILSEKPHTLGYCPAAFFWSDSITLKQQDMKEAPLTPQLYNLDWLLFFMLSKKHLDTYAAYPIYSAYASECDFENAENGDYCDGGFLRGTNEKYKVYRDGQIEKCPACSDKRLAGVGSFIEIPIPEKDGPDLSDPIKITTIDVDSLDFNVNEEIRLGDKIYKSVVGAGGVTESREALNEKHISSNYDAKTSVLNNLKVNLEKAEKFADDTCARLRYGDDFIGSYISLGTEFYIVSVSDLYAHYKQAKENGANESELDVIKDQIIQTEHRNDPMLMQRLLVLRNLEPYRHSTRDELLTLKKEGLIDEILFIIKINFNNFIDRFEREQTNILDFGMLMSFDKKIETITNKLKDYVNEQERGNDASTEGDS